MSRTDPVERFRLPLREIHGHVTATRNTLTAWYVLGQQRWSFTTDAQREQLIVEYARRLIALSGHRVRLRTTNRPYPAHQWARALDENTADPVGGHRGKIWSDHLAAAQEALSRSTLSDKVVYLGVDLPTSRRALNRAKATMSGLSGARAEIERHAPRLREITEVLAGPGTSARPARADEIEWLLHRSIRLGLPPVRSLSSDPTESWDPYDLHTFTDGVDYAYERFGPTVRISADYNGTVITRHVAVLTIGRMSKFTVPQTGRDPWMQATDRLPFPVEWASTFDVRTGAEAAKETARKRGAIRDMQKQYHEHDEEEPKSLLRKIGLARRIEDQVEDGSPLQAARAYGWYRLAVSADTEEKCLQRVRETQSLFEGMNTDAVHPRGLMDGAAQRTLIDEFTPGAPLSTVAYKRRLPATYVAAGLPHVTTDIGDRSGPLMGYTTGSSRRAFMHDPHNATEQHEASGLIVAIGTQGSGKSTSVVGKMAFEEAMRGITTTVLDPSGPLARLRDHSDLAGRARHLDLVDGDDGVLNPYAVIGEPLPQNYENEMKLAEAVTISKQRRRMLALDVARMLLPSSLDRQPETQLVLRDAVRAVGGERNATLWQVVDVLDKHDNPRGRDVANTLRDMADMPQARLFFPNNVRDLAAVTDTLLILTMSGIELPPEGSDDRDGWSTAEQMAVPLLHLATHYTTERAYGLARQERKMVALDEARMVARWGSGRNLFTRLAVDTRKWNLACIIASQNPEDILALGVANFISTAYIGRIEDEDTARAALRLLRIKEGAGYESIVQGLSPQVTLPDGSMKRGAREFVVKDVLNRVEKARIDMKHQPELLEVLNTTANPMAAQRMMREQIEVPA